jgi:methionyl-tRNA synthetase
MKRLEERYVHDLANTLGNLVNRSISMSRKYFDGKIPSSLSHEPSYTFADQHGVQTLIKEFESHIQEKRFDLALEVAWNGVNEKYGLIQANKFIEETKPFKLVKTDPDAVGVILYSLLEYCRIIAWIIEPFMPEVSRSILSQLSQDCSEEQKNDFAVRVSWGGLKPGTVLSEPKILFPPLEKLSEAK